MIDQSDNRWGIKVHEWRPRNGRRSGKALFSMERGHVLTVARSQWMEEAQDRLSWHSVRPAENLMMMIDQQLNMIINRYE